MLTTILQGRVVEVVEVDKKGNANNKPTRKSDGGRQEGNANNKPTRKSGGGRQEGNANNKPTRKSGGGRQELRREC